MDGNKRWADKNNKNSYEGYMSGLDNLKKIIEQSIKLNISYLTVFALSSENINRTNSIVIFNIIRKVFKKFLSEQYAKKINLKIVGEKEGIPEDIINMFDKYIDEIKEPSININVAFNYGTQHEMKNIIKKISSSKIKKNILKEIRNYMYLGSIPDPDLLIRTGGFQRLSNFMLLNLSYTELFFTNTLWPDFKIDEFNNILDNFIKIKRNYGL